MKCSQDEKDKWNSKSKELRDEYKRQLEEYEKHHGKLATAKPLTVLPNHKIKKIIRLNDTVTKITPEALSVLTRATELFLESIGSDCSVLARKLNVPLTTDKVFAKQV